MSRIEDLKDLRGESLWKKFLSKPAFTKAVYIAVVGSATVGLTARYAFKAQKTTLVHLMANSYLVLTIGSWQTFLHLEKKEREAKSKT